MVRKNQIEAYHPSLEERQNLLRTPEKLKLSGDGIFATLQGEGITAGEPAIFMRLHYCNLACGLESGWQCDTGYTWDKRTAEYWQEPYDLGYQETALAVELAWAEKFHSQNEPRLVVTGGEPLLQQRSLVELLKYLNGWQIEIETNGTIKPTIELEQCQFNCSPKLANSGNKLERRYKPEVLKYINNLPNSWFKFVVEGLEDLVEVQQIVAECGIDESKVLIMPEGQTANEVSAHASMIESEIQRHGWQLSLRHQLIWFGKNRKT
ncbi:MAG: 7-carboxy-7-deazaguanine synthase QueE [bacterium]|nr:7-carboxy-7-deazaguanine synthase QueE [bacterium]